MNVSPQAGFVPGAVATSQPPPLLPNPLPKHTLTNRIITQQPNRASASVEVTLARASIYGRIGGTECLHCIVIKENISTIVISGFAMPIAGIIRRSYEQD